MFNFQNCSWASAPRGKFPGFAYFSNLLSQMSSSFHWKKETYHYLQKKQCSKAQRTIFPLKLAICKFWLSVNKKCVKFFWKRVTMILDKFWKSNRRLIACKGWEWNKFKPNLKLYLQIFHTLFLSILKTLISFCVTKK